MRPATDTAVDYKLLVQRGYDLCADAYHAAREAEACPELNQLVGCLENGAEVLDIGCGAGVPISRSLSRRFAVTWVDISGEMVRRAAVNVPAGSFIRGDIMSVEFPRARFDAAVAFYSIFHLPRQEHQDLFRRIHVWLKPGGRLLATLSLTAEDPYIEDDFFGVPMYWSNHVLEDYRNILADVGFTVLTVGAVGHGYAGTQAASAERHALVLTRRSGPPTLEGGHRGHAADPGMARQAQANGNL